MSLQKYDVRVTGIDLSANMVAMALERAYQVKDQRVRTIRFFAFRDFRHIKLHHGIACIQFHAVLRMWIIRSWVTLNWMLSPYATSGSRPSETGGPNFWRNFWTTSFRHFPKNSTSICQNFWWPFFSHWPFLCFIWYFSIGGAKYVANIGTGGPKSLLFKKNHNTTIALSVPEGEAKLHCQFRCGGHGRICPPPGSATVLGYWQRFDWA